MLWVKRGLGLAPFKGLIGWKLKMTPSLIFVHPHRLSRLLICLSVCKNSELQEIRIGKISKSSHRPTQMQEGEERDFLRWGHVELMPASLKTNSQISEFYIIFLQLLFPAFGLFVSTENSHCLPRILSQGFIFTECIYQFYHWILWDLKD